MYRRYIFSQKVLNGIVAFMLLFVLAYRCMIAFSYAPELVNGESNNIWNAIKVSNGSPIYTDPEALPLEIFQYTPLSQLPIIMAAKVFDASDSDYVHNITVVGRLMSLLMNALTALMLFLACRLLVATDRWIIALGCLLGFISLSHLSFAIRPDATASFMMMSAFFFFIRHTVSGSQTHLNFSALILALAILAKQDAMVIVAPLSLLLLLQGKWKQLLLFDLVFITSVALVLTLSHFALGEHFISSIVIGVRNPASLYQIIAIFSRLLDFHGFHFIAGNTVIVIGLWRYKTHTHMLPLILTALFFEGFGFMTSAKIGSGPSYYTPFILFSSILILLMLFEIASKILSVAHVRFVSLVLVIMVFGSFLFHQTYIYTSTYLKYGTAKALYDHRWNELQQVINELRLKPDDRMMVVDPLTRIMLAHNTIMPNIEYYGISPFDYSQFRKGAADKVDHILFAPSDEASMRNLMQFFHIDASQFAEIETTTGFMILSRQAQ